MEYSKKASNCKLLLLDGYYTRDVLKDKYPEYEDAYDKAINRTWGYMFNMMIMERNLLDEYCAWLFDILGSIFKKVDTSSYEAFEKRKKEFIIKLAEKTKKKDKIPECQYQAMINWEVKAKE